jgi:hypothetical protein
MSFSLYFYLFKLGLLIISSLNGQIMSRPLCLEFADALYHITARGNARNLIFLQEDDFELFLQIFGDYFGLHYSQISSIIAKYKT